MPFVTTLAARSVSSVLRASTLGAGALALVGFGAALAAARDGAPSEPARVVGPSECAECHVAEFDVWQASHHQMGSTMLTRDPDAQKIARALGIRRVKNDARCTTCHFTMVGAPDASKAVAGVSCESCHGPARDWLDVHDEFGGEGATAATESPEHEAERGARCDELGMVRPEHLSRLAAQCFRCHVVDDQELVEAGHTTGDGFELVAWSQGEVRHNFVGSADGGNALASAARRRRMYVVGQLLELRGSIAALTRASGPGAFATSVVERGEHALARLEAIRAAVPIGAVADALTAAADWSREPGRAEDGLVARVDGSIEAFDGAAEEADLGALDALLPDASAFVGTPPR